MNKKVRLILQYCFFLGLGIFLVWWAIRDLGEHDRSQIKQALKNARYWLIIPVSGILFLSHYIRAIRWKLLIEPMGYRPRTANTVFAVFIGYLTNMAVPRLGEVLKCTVLANYEKVPADKLIGTIILERIIDAVCLLIVFGITLVIQPGLYTKLLDTFFQPGQEEEKSASGLLIFGIIAAVVLIAVTAWMIIKKKRLADVFELFKKIALRVWQGVSAIQHLKKRGRFIILTVLIWSLYLIGGYIGFFALQETSHFGIREAFSILSAGSIGMIVTPGGIGAYAFLLQKTMHLYGLQEGIALAFGWLLWLAQTAVVVVGGFFSFLAIPWYNKKRNNR